MLLLLAVEVVAILFLVQSRRDAIQEGINALWARVPVGQQSGDPVVLALERDLQGEQQKLTALLDSRTALRARQRDWAGVLEAAFSVAPDGLTIASLREAGQEAVTILGQARSVGDLEAFHTALRDSPVFGEAGDLSLRQEPDGTYSFTLQVKLP